MSAKYPMNLSILAATVCLMLSAVDGVAADTPAATPSPAPPAASAAPALSGDAAAKHAKRTACLKDAKAKKLVGADKSSFLKSCIGAP
jgi:hypothetical protein